ncbi:MAG: S8 family serine peptidase, partial [Anaerolineae bacterium]
MTSGVNLTNINGWHTGGYNGTGVNLAVFDFGFTNWTARKSSGDLPSGAVAKDFSSAFSFTANSNQGTAGYDHGTACAEIAYDMAPDATVYLYAFGTEVEFGNAVNDYRNNVNGKRVASMSIGWVNAGPCDGTGAINTIVDNAQSSGILWANSAGNQQKVHYSGVATQSGTSDAVAFGGGNIQGIGPTSGSLYNIPSGTTLTAFLAWNDWNAARTGNVNHIDYDIELYRWTGSSWVYVTGAFGNQCGNSAVPPVETLSYTVPAGGPYNYGIVIWRYEGSGSCPNSFGHWLSLHSFLSAGANNLWWYVNQCNSIIIPADGNSAVATGATFWNEDSTGPLYGLEPFSSLGPRNASGGGNPGAAVNKPDVVAPDGVSTVAYGASDGVNYASGGVGFWGTSAAAPHVAGMAATVWERNPAFSLSSLRNFIQGEAVYKADGGVCGGSRAPQSNVQNNRFGWGRINLGQPQAVTLAEFSAAQQGDAVQVSWETVSELDNAGFNLYRSESAAGPRTLLAYLPSASPGGTTGAAYSYEDRAGLVSGTTYYYWLEDVAISGATTLHGPVSVDCVAPTAVTLDRVAANPAAALPALPWLW